MMSKKFPISDEKMFGDNLYPSNKRALDGPVFFGGVILTMALPQLIYCAYGGPLFFIAFAVSGLIGLILGLAIYYLCPYRIISCVSKEQLPSSSPKMAELKKAA